MKNVLKVSKMALICLGLSAVILSCGDDDGEKKKKNQIKVDGKTLSFTKGYIVSEQITEEGEVLGSAHWVFLTGGDLEIEDNMVMSGEGDFLAMYLGADDDTDLIADEYDMEYGDYDFGNVIIFDLYDNYTFEVVGEDVVEVYDGLYAGNDEGDVTISRSGDKHVFKIDLENYYYLGTSDEEAEEEVAEDLTGYFSGELEAISMDELPGKIASKLRKSVKPTWHK